MDTTFIINPISKIAHLAAPEVRELVERGCVWANIRGHHNDPYDGWEGVYCVDEAPEDWRRGEWGASHAPSWLKDYDLFVKLKADRQALIDALAASKPIPAESEYRSEVFGCVSELYYGQKRSRIAIRESDTRPYFWAFPRPDDWEGEEEVWVDARKWLRG